MTEAIFYDIIGHLATAFSFFSFLSVSTNRMRSLGMISAILFGLSIYSYGGINGVFVTLISVIVKIISIQTSHSKVLLSVRVIGFFMSILFYLSMSEGGIAGALPAASLIFIIMADTQSDIKKMKMWYYGSASCWLAYAISINSVPAIIYDVVGILTLTYSLLAIAKKE